MKLLRTATIKINGKEYFFKRSIRAYLRFEEMTGHSIEDFQDNMREVVIFFYCCFQSGGNKESYEEFIDLIDNDPESIAAFSEAMIDKEEKKQKAV